MATHSSVLAWRIPGTGEPHGLPSMGSHRVRYDWSDLAVAAAGHIKYNFQSIYFRATLSCSSYLLKFRLSWKCMNIDIFTLIFFLCHSPKSSPTHPLPQSPKGCSIHLCLFCCLAYRVVITIFLNSIYMRYYTTLVFFFLAYFTLYNRLQFHPPH